MAVFGVSRFKGSVAVIAGAEHPLGQSLVRRLAAFGATVVALGRDEERLYALARACAGQVEPLALRTGRRDVLALLDQAWGAEPFDIYVDAMPLCPQDGTAALSENFARSAGVAAALVRGMQTGRAAAVIAVPRVAIAVDQSRQAASAGYAALMRRFARECRPGRMVGLRLPGDAAAWTDAALLSAGDSVLALCHPVSRGFAGGQVFDWEPDAAEARTSLQTRGV